MADAWSQMRAMKIPDTLYDLCLKNLVKYLHVSKCEKNVLRSLPDTILSDVHYKMLEEKTLCLLVTEMSDLDIFERALRLPGTQVRLMQCFHAVVEHGSNLSTSLVTAYLDKCCRSDRSRDSLIQLGLNLGSFFNNAGWFVDAQRILLKCRDMCRAQPQTTYYKILTLESCHRLLNSQSSYCCFPEAAMTYSLILELLGVPEETALDHELFATGEKTHTGAADNEFSYSIEESWKLWSSERRSGNTLAAQLCAEFSRFFFVRADYTKAYAWSRRGLGLLTARTPPAVMVEVYRACAKACVVKRRFAAAGLLVRQAVAVARAGLGDLHPRYATTLIDLGFYLLNIDCIKQSITVYKEALDTMLTVFGRNSMLVATTQEHLAYAFYVFEYPTGRFYKARTTTERAIRILQKFVPPDHLLLASIKRVKALIFEEIALTYPTEANMLEQSELLHKAALALTLTALGENNVQTAKHYGNLGRLYQSMKKYEDAEKMHLRAIAIKEELLGPEDYEVGLSVGHLASLYNYHMNKPEIAEKLYLRSISISLKLFGERYTGLEYDYRGLVDVFTKLVRPNRVVHYTRLLRDWREARKDINTDQPALGNEVLISLPELQAKFFTDN